MGRLGDGVDEDADTVGAEILGHRRADRQHVDVCVGLVFEDHLLGLLYAHPHHLRPRRLAAAALSCFRGGAHLLLLSRAADRSAPCSQKHAATYIQEKYKN
jgi:hypothetical protein